LAYESPRDKQIKARPLHSKEGGLYFQPDRGVTPPPSDIYGNELLFVHSLFEKSESADDWSEEEWEGPMQLPAANSSARRPQVNSYSDFQCEECRRQNRMVVASSKSCLTFSVSSRTLERNVRLVRSFS
jgi:hypothetical protein